MHPYSCIAAIGLGAVILVFGQQAPSAAKPAIRFAEAARIAEEQASQMIHEKAVVVSLTREGDPGLPPTSFTAWIEFPADVDEKTRTAYANKFLRIGPNGEVSLEEAGASTRSRIRPTMRGDGKLLPPD